MELKQYKNMERGKEDGLPLKEFYDVTPGVEVVMIRYLKNN
jgi:hypothetical protein